MNKGESLMDKCLWYTGHNLLSAKLESYEKTFSYTWKNTYAVCNNGFILASFNKF